MANKKIEAVGELDIFVLPTMNGIGVTFIDDRDRPFFREYPWKSVMEDLLEFHTVTVFSTRDVRTTMSSRNTLLTTANTMIKHANNLKEVVSKMEVIDGEKSNKIH